MTPHRLTARMRCQFSSGPKLLLSGPMPALFIRMSVPPNRFCTAASSACDVIEAADVDGGCHHIGGAALGDGRQRCRGLGEPVGPDIGDTDFHAEAGKARCGGKPDAGGASGDDGNIVRRHGGMGQIGSPDRSRSPHFTGLFATRHRSHARAEPRWRQWPTWRFRRPLPDPASGASVAGGHAIPPRLERGAVAAQLDAHPVGELDPVLKCWLDTAITTAMSA